MFRPAIFASGGLLLIVTALVFSSTAMESLFSRPVGSLAWGPALFRILLALHGAVLVIWAFAGAATSARPDKAAPKADRRVWFVLAALSLVALALRLWRLDSGLWLDEVLTLVDFARPPLATILTSFPNQNQHMLYSILAHGAMGIFGEQAWALRLPSVLFGVGSIWALFLLGRRLIGAQEALWACALMTVSYHHIWFSQNARGYMALLFFATLATWLWLEALSRNSRGWWVAYSFATFLGVWSHLTMVFVVAAHGLIWLAFLLLRSAPERRAGWKPLAAWLLCGTLSLQAHALALPEFFRTALHEVSMPSEWTNPFWVVAESLRSLKTGFSGLAVVLCAVFLVLAGWNGIFRREPRAALAMVLPALLGGGAMLALGHNLWPRFFFFSMGFALLIVVHGAALLPRLALAPTRWSRFATPAGAVLSGLLVTASALTVPRCYAFPKQDFIGARDYVEQHRVSGAPVAVVGLATHAYGKYYAPHWAFPGTSGELEALRRKHSKLSLVYTLPIELKAFHPEVWRVVEKEFQTVRIFPGTLGGGEVYVSRPRF